MKCVNGHEIAVNESFCTTCGSKAAPTSGFSSSTPPATTPPTVGIPVTSLDGVSPAPTKSKASNLKVIVPAIIGVVALLLIFVVAFANSSKTLTVVTTQYHATCADLDSSNSVFDGAEITVKGPDQKIVGSGVYGEGQDGRDNDSSNNRVDTCTFTTDIQVPSNLASYKVIVDTPPGITFQLSELKRNDWEASILVGYRYNPNAYNSSYSDGYDWGYDNAYSSSDCSWYDNGPSYDNSYDWERGCHAGWLNNDN